MLLANLYYKKLRPLPLGSNLKNVSDFVAKTTQLSVDEHRPVIGKKAFWHVADLHVKSMNKNSNSYNWIQPELVGQKTKCFQKLNTPPFSKTPYEQSTFTETEILH